MSRVYVTDTVLRDGHQSLIATRMRTEDMLPICSKLDKVGFWSLETWGGATFDSCIRFLKEDPWERLRTLRAALPNTRMQMLLRGQNLLGYRHYSDDVVHAFVKAAAENGMDVFRIFDALNDARNMRSSIEAVKKVGKHAQGTICYTTSPVHNVATFVALGKELESMGCDSVALKDMAGLLTPNATAELVKALRAAIKLPIHIHSHATAGLAEMCQLRAIENGASNIDTAISSFAGGTSHPPTESMVCALRGTEYDTGLDLELLQEIGMYFFEVRKKYHQFESDYTGVDTRVQVNQVPGGMISNLANQLRDQGALNKMREVLEEIPRVRADLGYPPLVTPTSQIVGSQSALNVMSGERYKVISNEVKIYLQGGYGKAPGVINEELRQMAIGNDELITCRPADLLPNELDRLRTEIGDLAKDECDVLTFAMFPDIGKQFLQARKDGTLKPEELKPRGQIAAADGVKTAPTEFNVCVHGETYHIRISGSGKHEEGQRRFFMTLDGVPEDIMIETLDEIVLSGGAQGAVPAKKQGTRPKPTHAGDVTTAMPATIVAVLVKEGDVVKAGQAVLVTEAMKMETELHAPIAGTVKHIYANKGDPVNPNEALMTIE
jgi:pyruvate carboxylase subunit B